MEKIFINARDNYELELHVFKVSKPKAVIQVIHGMEEHQERYEDFIKKINKNGYSVVSSNLRGHGANAKELGFFKEDDGYKELIQDQMIITKYIKTEFKKLDIYIFAHSMGTIITRVLLQNNSNDYKKVALSGYPNFQVGAYFGIFIANIIGKLYGPKHKSKLIAALSVDAFNKKIKNPKTNFDWVSYNEDNINSYIKDPYCGFGFTTSAFNDLFHLVILMHKSHLYKNVNKDLEILLLRGLDDPCVGENKGANDSFNVLKKAGFIKIKSLEYPNMRHELLAEKENKKVYLDILNFFSEGN